MIIFLKNLIMSCIDCAAAVATEVPEVSRVATSQFCTRDPITGGALRGDMPGKRCRLLLLQALLLLCLPSIVHADYLTPETWDATRTSVLDGRLQYRTFAAPVDPGMNGTAGMTKKLLVDSGCDLRDTVYKAPETVAAIYDTGIVGNFLQYRGMVVANWH